MSQYLQGTGVLKYNPKREEVKKRADSSWLILDVDWGISEYYRWWIKKRFGLDLQPPMWGTHITVIDGRVPIKPEFQKFWEAHSFKNIPFEYSPIVEQHWKFWSLPVRSKELEKIRSELGFNPKYTFHITVGRMY